MAKKKIIPLTPVWEKSRKLVAENKLDEADDILMKGIWIIAGYTLDGYNDDYKIEGVKKSVWYERFWVLIETAGLLP